MNRGRLGNVYFTCIFRVSFVIISFKIMIDRAFFIQISFIALNYVLELRVFPLLSYSAGSE